MDWYTLEENVTKSFVILMKRIIDICDVNVSILFDSFCWYGEAIFY